MNAEQPPKLKTGTTTLGLICKDAVVVAADRKATMGYLVATKDAQKISQVDSHIAMTMAGLQGDGQALERYLRAELKLFKLKEGRRSSMTAASNLLASILYSRRFYPYYVQLILAGFDTGPHLYSFDASGAIQEEHTYFSSGSGSPFAFGVLENGYKKGMDIESGKKLAVRAVKAATERDIASGGSGIDLVVITEKGFRRYSDAEVKKLLA